MGLGTSEYAAASQAKLTKWKNNLKPCVKS